MYAHIKQILRKAYDFPPRPKGNFFYMSGVIQTLSDLGHLTKEETEQMFELLVHRWSSHDCIPDVLEDHYKNLVVGDTVICSEDLINKDDEISFVKGKEYDIKGIYDSDGIKILVFTNELGYRHLIDNEDYHGRGGHDSYDFDRYFKIKRDGE